MDDYGWVPLLATGAAGFAGAAVTWRVSMNRSSRLRMATDVADKIPIDQQARWKFMIADDAEVIMRQAAKPVAPFIPSLVGAPLYLAASLTPFPQVLELVGLALLLLGTAMALVDFIGRRSRLRARLRTMESMFKASEARAEEQEAEIAALEEMIAKRQQEAEQEVLAQGFSRRDQQRVLDGIRRNESVSAEIPAMARRAARRRKRLTPVRLARRILRPGA